MRSYEHMQQEMKENERYLWTVSQMTARLLAKRYESGMSQTALAGKAGVSRETIAKMETGDRFPRMDTLTSIAKALGMMIVVIDDNE